MNAPLREDSNIDGWVPTDIDELLGKLQTREGIEAEYGAIEVATDGTFEFQGHKVLVYIRDQTFYSQRSDDGNHYRFHVAECQTIKRAQKENRQNRYVVTNNTEGVFLINKKDKSTGKEFNGVNERLLVCKNCLRELNYKNYKNNMAKVWAEFSIMEFFELYGGNLISSLPTQTEKTAPLNTYSRKFKEISQSYRKRCGWKCEKCGVDLINQPNFLHVHHKNADKSDNRIENLQSLCIACHAEEPSHDHMKNLPDYKKYLFLYGRLF